MGLLDIFKFGSESGSPKFRQLFDEIIHEANLKKTDPYSDFSNYHVLKGFNDLLQLSDQDRNEFIYFLLEEIKRLWLDYRKRGTFTTTAAWYHGFRLLPVILRHIKVSDDTFLRIAKSLNEFREMSVGSYYLPGHAVVEAMEKSVKKKGLNPVLRQALETLIHPQSVHLSSDEHKQNDLIYFLLQDDPSLEVAEHDPWGKMAIEYLKSCDPKLRSQWVALFSHIKTASDKSTPAAKWLKGAEPLVRNIGHEIFAEKAEQWLKFVQGLLQDIHKSKLDNFLRNENHEIIKGLIWCAGIVNNPSLNTALDEYASWAYKKKPGIGAISAKTGTAAMFAFSILPVKEGVSRLSKFRTKMKNKTILKAIDKIIRSVSEKNNIGIDDLQELSVPDFGIKNATYSVTLGDVVGHYSLISGEMSWEKGARVQKSIPADAKEKFSAELKAFKNNIKEIEALIPVIKARLEQSYLQQRTWTFANWYKLYIEHPLTSIVAKKLIWHFTNGTAKDQGILVGEKFINRKGEVITWLDDKVLVQLWHPIGFSSNEILEWRKLLVSREIIQPFKQAYREVYMITDAELRTETYSNRFAAHILRQHQFAALCRQRGWSYTLMGSWDSHNTPYIVLPSWNIQAQFYVEANSQEGEHYINASGIFNYVTTDQVRFMRDGQPLPLQDVPAMVFTEIMRDVDLFVGVTSIGNDPTWQDGGDNFQNTYWSTYSFSELSESAKVRSEVLQMLIPGLKIAPLCSFDKKFLIVKGKLRTYKIHMGSGNILMEPDDKYLCIVPEGKTLNNKEKVFLPFEGDALLSIILSKAFLLAADDKITDTSITRQIGG